jgi:DNA-binding PadR family transcriptional regulator
MERGYEARVIRGRILKILDLDYPREMGDVVIVEALREGEIIISTAVLAGYLDYLEEKGYVETRETSSRELGMTMKMAKLTAHGKDLLEGNIDPDVGVRL